MDFGVLGLDNLFCSDSTNNGGLASENTAGCINHKRYGSGFLNQERTVSEDDLREYKVAKTSSSSEAMLKNSLQRSYNSGLNEVHQQMLSFSSPNSQTLALPYYPFNTNTGYGSAGINAATIQGVLSGFRGPFTTSQWMELEHQALIYKYIDANVPIPSYLLNPIRKALESAGFSAFSGLRPNALGWGGFHLGFSNSDPEPGRCRRTDGKKWRCSRDAVADQKYCERHMNRGRHRSRKPVEGHSASAPLTTNTVKLTPPMASVVPAGGDANNLGLSCQLDNFQHPHNNNHLSGIPNVIRNEGKMDGGYRMTVLSMSSPKISHNDGAYSISKEQNAYGQQSTSSEFGLVCSDSLLNPLNKSSSLVNTKNSGNESHHPLRQFMDEWPKSQSESPVISWPDIDMTQLSISIPMVTTATSDFMSSTSSPTNEKLTTISPLTLSCEFEATKMGLGVGPVFSGQSQRRIVSWEPSMGGPLGEVLHPTSNECKRTKALNLMESWDNSPRLAVSSPTGVLQRCGFGSVSNSSAGSSPRAESSKTLDGPSLCNGLVGTGFMHPL